MSKSPDGNNLQGQNTFPVSRGIVSLSIFKLLHRAIDDFRCPSTARLKVNRKAMANRVTSLFSRTIFLATLLLAHEYIATCADAQERLATAGDLSIDSIFADRRFKVEPFTGHWQSDSQGFELIRKDEQKGTSTLVRIGLSRNPQEEVLVPSDWLLPAGAKKPISIDAYEWSADRSKLLIFTNTRRVWRLNSRGDYWMLDIPSRKLTQLGGDAPEATLMFAKFSPDGTRVGYVQNNDLYLQSLSDLTITRLTDTGSPTLINGTFDWAYEEEFQIRDGYRFSPDGQRIAFWQIDSSGIELFPLVDNTSTLYPKIQYIPYPKVGTPNPAARIGIMELATKSLVWAKIPGDQRDNYLPRIDWVDADQLAVQQINRKQNRLQMYLVDSRSGDAQATFTDEDKAWVDVPDETLWMKDKSKFLWLSERSGWRHIYAVSRDGKTVQPITSGDYDVIQILGIDEPKQWIYFYASPDNASQKYLYRVSFDGSGLRRLSPADQAGTYQYILSPDRQRALVTFSRFATPPQTDVVRLSDHQVEYTVEANDALRDKVKEAELPPHRFFRVDLGEGVELDGWAIEPPNLDSSKKYPVIVFVYGEPAGQTVLDQWSGDRTLWHHLLAKRGYVVLSFDNRGTPGPRGRAWRKSIYRQIGVLASADQAAAVRSMLASHKYLDPQRVGVWGWSGGGSMTLNLLFRSPEIYAAGVSVAPVPNQLYYDTIYQERYMDLAADNPEGYRLGSPITHAANLKGKLLLIHGTGDDNCHYQTTELLINELIKLNKPFSMFAYPNRSHAIREGENTTRHLYQMITDHFLQTLPAGPR
jgi:dipeptidyl-peptidase 4